MKILKASYKINEDDISPENISLMIRKMEKAARICYKTENIKCETTEDAAKWLRDKIIRTGHHSILEHGTISVDLCVDRGILGEISRHRTGIALSASSTRYCNYSKNKYDNEISVIQPFFFDAFEEPKFIQIPIIQKIDTNMIVLQQNENNTFLCNSLDIWFLSCLISEWAYMTLVQGFGRKAEEARSILPFSLITDINITCNIREWRHILNLRALDKTGKAHPQMKEIMIPLLKEFQEKIPYLFDDDK